MARVETDLCYSPRATDGIDVWVPFNEANAGAYGDGEGPTLTVTVTSPRSDMAAVLEVEPHQRKSVFVGQLVKATPPRGRTAAFLRQSGLKDDGPTIRAHTAEPYQADLFYDGKNAAVSATLRVRAAQFAHVVTVERPGSWVDVFGSVGGANILLFGLFAQARLLFLADGVVDYLYDMAAHVWEERETVQV